MLSRRLVFDEKKYTLREVNNALLADFKGYEKMQQDMKDCEKYGNDNDAVDAIACDLFNLVAKANYELGPSTGYIITGMSSSITGAIPPGEPRPVHHRMAEMQVYS